MSKILVTGATGQLGQAVVTELLHKTNAGNISVLVRDLAKAEELKAKGINVIQGDYNEYESLVADFRE
nr:NmrA family NAD(P)-binding protein [Pontibacter sp. E15-1]